jgi:hypothetical protein
MKIFHNKPPIYEKLHEVFGVEWDHGLIIAYGENVHCKFDIPIEKAIHESVHLEQQKATGLEKWWDEYIKNPHFRLNQEVGAYRTEIDFVRYKIKDRNAVARYIHEICCCMAGDNYGKMCTYSQAKKLIS